MISVIKYFFYSSFAPFLIKTQRTRRSNIFSKLLLSFDICNDKAIDNRITNDKDSRIARVVMHQIRQKCQCTLEDFFGRFTSSYIGRYALSLDKESRNNLTTFWMWILRNSEIFSGNMITNVRIFFSKIFIYDDFALFVGHLLNDQICCRPSKSKITTKNKVKSLIFELFRQP